MTVAHWGMAVGAVLAVSALAFGFWGMILVAVAIAIGWGIGRIAEGKLDLRSLADTVRGRRSS